MTGSKVLLTAYSIYYMDRMMKYLGGSFLLLLLMAHFLLLGIFFAPTDKLLASILPPESQPVTAADIPASVEEFLVTNNIDIPDPLKPESTLFTTLVTNILELRKNRLMGESEKLALNLNLLIFGENVIGIDAASRYYFKKPISEITDSQWITLVNLQKIFSK
jgi:hypothetical protein